MKKIISVAVTFFMIVSAFAIFASASLIPSERIMPRLTDGADLIPDNSESGIVSMLDRESEAYGVDMVIATVSSTEGKSVEAYADDFFDYNGFGIGDDASGVILVISMNPREVYVSTSGSAIDMIDSDSVIEDFYSSLVAGDYYSVCKEFVSSVENEINYYEQYGESYYSSYGEDDYYSSADESPNFLGIGLISLIVGLIASSIAVSSMKRKMTTVRQKNQAEDYLVKGSLALSVRDDNFLYRNVNRVPKPKEPPRTSSGGSHSTHVSSSGRTHGGSGRSF